MDPFSVHPRQHRGHDVNPTIGRRGTFKNKTWVAGDRSNSSSPFQAGNLGADALRWERGGSRGAGRGRGRGKGRSPRPELEPSHHRDGDVSEMEDDTQVVDVVDDGTEIGPSDEPILETLEERDRFYQELVRARDAEKKRAIAEGKMDDPLVPKRLDEAITMVGTCMDMCPRFERYRRERENNLFNWEVIPGTKRVDHKRAVKMYERAAGDKTIPSDLRPPPVLKRTLDYLFHELLPREGFSPTAHFIRDRSRAVRNDFTMQHETGALAIECHERCARFHLLALHFERDRQGFSVALEEQQLMNTLQSLKEFYEDQRNRYESPNELEMRIYHRLIHIRDQRERHDDIPESILSHPVFLLTTKFRQHVQAKSSPITKTSTLVVDEEGMHQFAELAALLREQGNRVMVYLVACILERHFGKDTIEDIEAIREGLAIPDIVDGVLSDDGYVDAEQEEYDEEEAFLQEDEPIVEHPPATSAFIPATSVVPPAASAFANLKTTPNVFGNRIFGSNSAFGNSSSVFGGASSSAFGTSNTSLLGDPTKPASTFSPFGPSASAPAVSDPTSTFGPPTLSTLPAPAPGIVESSSFAFSASQSVPSGSSFGASPTPSGPVQQKPLASALNPKAPAFSPGLSFGTSVQDEKKPTEKPFSPSSSFSTVSPSSTVTRPVLPPIKTSSLPSNSTSIRPPPNLTTSQSMPPLNGFPKQPSLLDRLERQPTLVDGIFRPPNQGTQPSDGSRASEAPDTNASPQHPPPVRIQPISLPGTPVSYSPPSRQKSINLFGWNSSSQSLTGTDEILSPLAIPKNSLASLPSPPISARPSIARFPSMVESPITAGQSGPSPETTATSSPDAPSSPKETLRSRKLPLSPQDVEMASPTAVPLRNGKSKGKGKAPAVDLEELEAQASAFARTSAFMRDTFKRWAAKASDRVLYNDAVRRSDAYTVHKSRKRQETRSLGDADPENKIVERRTRRRISAKYTPPQTDAELARRLKENHEQHERRWAPGTFLSAVRTRVGDPAPFDYCLWLSLNPENDGTAIWVERKFDMPKSGAWAFERVFSIPLSPDVAMSRSPGLVVFECSPLHGVPDEIEKKYRILDDCARLREVIEAFPEDRHFIPSILFILWGEDESETLPDDLRSMAGDYETRGIVGSHATFCLSSKTKDLDEKFTQVLNSMDLDTAGGLVEILSRQEFLQLVIAPWKDFALDWVARCSADGETDWQLFSKVFEALVRLMNTLSVHFTTRLDESALSNPLPEIRLDEVKSSRELYDATFSWLEHKDLRTPSREFRTLLQSYHTSDADFPVHAFVDELYDLSVRCIESSVRIDRAVRYPVPKRDIEETKSEVESNVAEVAAQLRSLLLFHTRPKRPPPDDDDDDEGSVRSMSPSSKRLKSTFSSFSTLEDLASNELMPPPSAAVSPSTSVTTIVNEEKPQKVITVAMLRALTQSVLKKRGV